MNWTAAYSAENATAITPNDGANLPNGPSLAIYVGGAGNIKVDTVRGQTGVVFNAAVVGILFLQVTKVYATGTTATNLVALY